MSIKPKVAFICTHNSCRSQMAEAISKIIASDAFDAYSAGTEIKKEINPDAVETIKKLYGIDMTQSQRPKLLHDIPPVDIVITMGCGVQCPLLPCKHREDWGLEDPTGKPEKDFLRTADIIKEKITKLKAHVSDYL
jgi:arsenate reductase